MQCIGNQDKIIKQTTSPNIICWLATEITWGKSRIQAVTYFCRVLQQPQSANFLMLELSGNESGGMWRQLEEHEDFLKVVTHHIKEFKKSPQGTQLKIIR
eukprot:12138845-Ditylum_brightwellii.AAC.1